MGAKKKSLQAGELDWRASRFVEKYVETGNATQSYIAVGFSANNADSNACAMLKRPHIAAALEKERNRIKEALDFKREKHLRILYAIATARISDFAGIKTNDVESFSQLGHLEYALESIEDCRYGVKIKLADRKWALDELSRILGFEAQGNIDSGDDLDIGMASTVEAIQNRRKTT